MITQRDNPDIFKVIILRICVSNTIPITPPGARLTASGSVFGQKGRKGMVLGSPNAFVLRASVLTRNRVHMLLGILVMNGLGLKCIDSLYNDTIGVILYFCSFLVEYGPQTMVKVWQYLAAIDYTPVCVYTYYQDVYESACIYFAVKSCPRHTNHVRAICIHSKDELRHRGGFIQAETNGGNPKSCKP